MSQFKQYADRLNDVAKATFAEITATNAAFKTAEQRRKECPQKSGFSVTPEYQAKAARAEAAYQDARAALDRMRRNLPDEKVKEVAALRQELENAVKKAYSARPEDIDSCVLTLLQSGIMRPDEYSALMEKAGTTTMKRLIAKFANDAAADAEKVGDKQGAQTLRIVAQQGMQYSGQKYLDSFDVLFDAFARCLNNPAMIGHWNALTNEIIQNF